MSKIISNIGILISFIAILTVTYISVIQNYYFIVDDYFSVFDERHFDQVRAGRFLSKVLINEIWSYIKSSPTIESGVRVIRFTGIIGIALLAHVIFNIFKTFRFKTEHAFLISILICTLPSIQTLISDLQVITAIYSAVLAALSSLLLFKVVFKENSKKISYTIIAVLFAIILLISALCIYQPPAMIFWSMAVIPLYRLRNEDLIRKWRMPFITYFSIGIVSMAIYFLIIKIVHLSTHTNMPQRGAIIDLTMIKWKVKWFLLSPLVNSLNLWNISPTYTLGSIVGIIILAGLLLGLKQAVLQAAKERRFELILNHSQRMFLIMCIMPLSLLPSLVIIESWATYRTLLALEATICILLFISLLDIGEFLRSETRLPANFKKKVIQIILIVLTILAIFEAHNNIKKYIAELHSLELQYVRNIIQEYGIDNLSKTKRIYVRDHGKKYHFVENSLFEFGQPESNDPEIWKYIVKFALYELNVKREIDYTLVPADAPLPEDSNALIIDLAKLGFTLDERLKN